jgi:hypothetical protein
VKNLKRVVGALLLAAAVCAGVWFGMGHRTPPGQPPLGTISLATFQGLQDAFNREADDHARIVLLLSPT